MNCIIIDDENHCIQSLTKLIEKKFSEVKILGTCLDSTKAFDQIMQLKPDFIFLDIEMPFLNGFDLLSKFEKLFFEVIFTTAYDSYAIKAIKFSALDYLLKPINPEDLGAAIEKVKSKQSFISQEQLRLATTVNNRHLPDTIALPTMDGLTFTQVNDIIYFSAESNYTRIHLIDKSDILLSKTLGDVDELFRDYHFFRIHSSSLINLKQVKKYIRGDGGEVIMSNGQNLQVARTRKTDFLNEFMRI
jgi:two-component system LytT family response regulator